MKQKVDQTQALTLTATIRGTRTEIAYELEEAARAVREGYLTGEGWELEPEGDAQ